MHNEEVRAPTGLRYAEYLKDLALDMRWSWNPEADELWSQLDPDLWDRTHNPWVLLQTISRDRLESLSADPAFRVTYCLTSFDAYQRLGLKKLKVGDDAVVDLARFTLEGRPPRNSDPR